MKNAALARALRRARAGYRMDAADIRALEAAVGAKPGHPTRDEINVLRVAYYFWRLRMAGRTKEHAIDDALQCYPGLSPSGFNNHLIKTKTASARILPKAEALFCDWCEVDAEAALPDTEPRPDPRDDFKDV